MPQDGRVIAVFIPRCDHHDTETDDVAQAVLDFRRIAPIAQAIGDPAGPPGKTPDSAAMEAEFTDPQGNEYRVVLDHVVKPPFPGYETDGGVMLDDVHHGSTGTGTPLMPQVWTIGAFWGVGEVYVNGELEVPRQVMQLMTSETVRTTITASRSRMPCRSALMNGTWPISPTTRI